MKQDMVQFNLLIPRKLHRTLKSFSEKYGVSMHEIIKDNLIINLAARVKDKKKELEIQEILERED